MKKVRFNVLSSIATLGFSCISHWVCGQQGIFSYGKNTDGEFFLDLAVPKETQGIEPGKYSGYQVRSGKTETIIWKPTNLGLPLVKSIRFGKDTLDTYRASDMPEINWESSDVSCGYAHTLFLVKGIVWGQGINTDGRIGDLGSCKAGQFSELAKKTAIGISAGGKHSLVLLDNGMVKAYGNNDFYQCLVPNTITPSNPAKAVAAGFNHSLVLMNDGTVIAFGDNSKGQCNIPPQITTSNPAIAISTKGYHNLVLLKSGKVLAFGDNQFGQCDVSKYIPSQDSIVRICAGLNHSAVLNATGGVYLFGDNAQGQCNFSSNLLSSASVESMDAGYDETVFLLKDGSFVFLGKNEFGEGTPNYEFKNINRTKVLDFATGTDYSAYVFADGRLVDSRYNRLNYRNLSTSQKSKFKSIHGGFFNAALLYSDGGVEMIYRQNPTDSLEVIPGYSPSSNPIVQVSVGVNHNYGILKNGDLIAWGDNTHGQCDFQKHVPKNRSVRQVELGYAHTLLLLDNDSVIAFGWDSMIKVDPNTGNPFVEFTGQTIVPNPSTKIKLIKAFEYNNLIVSQDNKIDLFGLGGADDNFSALQFSEGIKDIGMFVYGSMTYGERRLWILFQSDTMYSAFGKSNNYKIQKIVSRGWNALLMVKEPCIPEYSLSVSADRISVIPDTLDVRWLDCKNQYSHRYNADAPSFLANEGGYFAAEVRSKYCLDTSDCFELAGNSTGILPPTNKKASVRIKTNPVDRALFIENMEKDAEYSVVNSMGACVKQGFTNSEIVVEDLVPGVYLIYIQDTALKFVKQ